jgi:hypothetical protein
MHFPTINVQYINEYLDLLAVGATHEEAVRQVALQNEVDAGAVENAVRDVE